MAALFGPPRPSSQSLVQHPLLTNPAYVDSFDRELQSAFAAVPGGAHPGGGSMAETMGPDAARLVESILTRHREAGRTALSIGMATTPDGGVAIDIGGRRYRFPAPALQTRTEAAATVDLDISTEFIPKPTLQRWHDEMAVCGDDSTKLVNHIINRLLPEAKIVAEAEAEKTKKAEQEAREKHAKAQAEASDLAIEKAKKAEADLEANALAAAAVALPDSRVPTPLQDVEMEAAAEPSVTETADPDSTAGTVADSAADDAAGPSTEAPAAEESIARTIISIHGRDVDITGTGIDLEFLQALPDEMRADVVEQHMREHNRNREPVADSSLSSQISPEFLEALPDEIRSEIMLQERMERARNLRPTTQELLATDRAAGNDQPDPPAPRPPTALPPLGLADIRRRLMEGAEAALGPTLAGGAAARRRPTPEEMLAIFNEEFNSGTSGLLQTLGRAGDVGALGAGRPPIDYGRTRPAATGEPPHKRHKRDAVQLLDKPGVASLVRLLFFPEAFKRDYLFRVLINLCENSSTRSDLLNLLISVVQDGTGDLLLVDKSFSQMSLKPGVTPKSTPKTPKMPDTPMVLPQPSPSNLFAKLQADHIPTFIAQRCFEALTYIVTHNSMAVNYFLTEHEQPVGLRKPLSKKGKGKEKLIPQTKFPIVVLLGFLDRAVLLKAPGMMESFTLLLSSITKPLATLKPIESKEDTKEGTATAPEAAPASSAAPVPAVHTPLPATVATPARDKVGESSTAPASSSTLTRAPVIPDSVLRLVVNCLTVGECPSRTFGNALSIMQNLSTVAGAKTTILIELRDRAQQLGQDILGELQELNTTLLDRSAELSTAALVKFSPASSSQAQLLRLLKTIDYLHSEKVDSDPPGETLTEQEKAIAQTFDSFDFDVMWKQLSECLSTVDARGSTDQISAVLLPLVEALMVICKYRRPEARETRSPSLPPSSIDETDSLFVTFTTTHRKVLNAIVRTNPGLLSGSFSLLVRNPRVLEFDNKRNWFLQKLKRKRDQPAHSPVLHLNIRRQYVFEDSFRALERRTGNEVKYGKLSVKFYNEDGIDAGGVTREWYSVLAQQIFDPNFGEFFTKR
jgi:E3 ubiquitin-protein ligase HUWE1